VGLLAVILAAGTGTRLRPLTDATPKCLLDINGRALLDRLFEGLAAAGLGRAVIVTGHLSERVEAHLAEMPPPLDVMVVTNPAYRTTNNAASLAAACTEIGHEDFLLCDGDVIFSPNPLPALLAVNATCALTVDASVSDDAEAMKVELAPDGRVKRISKHLSAAASAGESIGLQKIGGEAVPLLWEILAPLVACAAATAYYEDAFQRLIDRGIRFGTARVAPGTWMEIDDAADLEAARRMFRT
jgi:choline kinase